jgi:hypothetical protein
MQEERYKGGALDMKGTRNKSKGRKVQKNEELGGKIK